MTGNLDTVKVELYVGSDSGGTLGDLTAKIEGINSGLPDDGNVLATQTVPESSVPTTPPSTTTIAFSTPASVQSGTQYAVVLSTSSGTGSVSTFFVTSFSGDYYALGVTGDNYARGQYAEVEATSSPFGNTGPAWTSTANDAIFSTYVSPPPPPPTIGVSPASVSFGNQPLGSTSSPQTVTITNTASAGSQSLAIGTLATNGANAGDFTLSNDHCSNKSVTPGNNCTVDVSFGPTATGSRTATLNIPSNAASGPGTVALSGTGTPSADVALTMSGPSSAARGRQVTYVITVSNAGPSTAHNVVMSDPVPSGAKFLGVTTSRGTCTHSTGGNVKCSLGDLANGGSAGSAVSVKMTARVGGTVTNVASAYSTADSAGPATFDPNTSNNWKSLSTTVT
jgi:uncharacterized repeat protein (TIGR01451 family)